MSGRIPYEKIDEQFNDLPLPDADTSWQRMKELLEKKDDDDRVVPPFLFRTCLGWTLLSVTALYVVWLAVRPDRWKMSSERKKSTSSDTVKRTSKDTGTEGGTAVLYAAPKNNQVEDSPGSARQNVSTAERPILNQKKKNFILEETRDRHTQDLRNNQRKFAKRDIRRTTRIDQTIAVHVKNSPDIFGAITVNAPKQLQLIKADEADQSGNAVTNEQAKQLRKKWTIAVGIGEQQQIPIAGQSSVPYSYYGRKGSLSDYVPLLYLQLQKNNRWFAQTEFRFGAAQAVKEFSYNQTTKYDTTSMNLTTTTLRLKKTYYHQLPVSFNYYLKPNLSLGVGGIYSRFYGAISEREITTTNFNTQTASSSKQIIPIKHFTDSFLYKTQLHFLLQANFQIGKFSLGLRYTRDLQPYIRFTRPDGSIDNEKNQSLQLMLRYRLWQSRKF